MILSSVFTIVRHVIEITSYNKIVVIYTMLDSNLNKKLEYKIEDIIE